MDVLKQLFSFPEFIEPENKSRNRQRKSDEADDKIKNDALKAQDFSGMQRSGQ